MTGSVLGRTDVVLRVTKADGYVNINGNTGIGLLGPSYRLHVSSGAGFSGTVLAVSTGTSDMFKVLGTGEVQASTFTAMTTGSTGAAAFTFSGDYNTGIYSPGSNQLGITTAGTERLRVKGSGVVGIGNSSPSYRLHVSSGSGETGTILAVSTSTTNLFEVKGTGEARAEISASDYISLNPGSGPLYAGTARPGKVITLSPEYPGATLSADGSGSAQGSMTSDNAGSSGGWRNYYEWSSTQTSLNDYTVMARVTLPNDFDTWETGSCPGATCALEIEYQTGTASSADNAVSFQINNSTDTAGSTVCTASDQVSTSWTSSGLTCAESVLNDNAAPEWDAPGETAVIRIKLKAKSTASALARVGDIKLRYKAKF
jgi:hypothetical protein